MKTALETIKGLTGASDLNETITVQQAITAMKAYASQVIDECARVADTKDLSKIPYEHYDVVDKESILKIKSDLK